MEVSCCLPICQYCSTSLCGKKYQNVILDAAVLQTTKASYLIMWHVLSTLSLTVSTDWNLDYYSLRVNTMKLFQMADGFQPTSRNFQASFKACNGTELGLYDVSTHCKHIVTHEITYL